MAVSGVSTATRIPIERVGVTACRVPTGEPESDGTLEWSSTTIVIVEAEAGGRTGMGYSYADPSAASIVEGVLAPAVEGGDAMAIGAAWREMVRAVRNLGRPGVASHAISALDVALWDLKARLLGLSVAELLGTVRGAVPVYGSGGFTSLPVDALCDQLAGWVRDGIGRVKMKVGRDPASDAARVAAAREAVGPGAELFVDANGAYGRQEALGLTEAFAEAGVTWFEEPVSSDDLDGLRLLRDRSPAGMAVAAGEYGYDLPYFSRMLTAGAVDVLQADATRCCGITGIIGVDALCQAHGLALSAHTAPGIHAHAGCGLPSLAHVEYFHDHVRIEAMLFEGSLTPVDGCLAPDLFRPGLGLALRREEMERWAC